MILKGAQGETPVRFQVAVIHDPRYPPPLVLGLLLETGEEVSGADARGIYRDRWPVEGLPQGAKGILGAGRQFVFGPESRQRLPETVLLAGSILASLAATEPAHASGFWDRQPKPTAGRLRRVLSKVHFDHLGEIPKELRRKDSPTQHLPKGVQAHRRQKRSIEKPVAPPPPA